MLLNEEQLQPLKKWELVELIKRCNVVIRQKYPRVRGPRKVQDKAFVPEELELFYQNVRMPFKSRFFIACKLMQYLGLRPCEIVALKLSDFDIQNKTLKVVNSKVHNQENILPLRTGLYRLLFKHVVINEKKIIASGGFLFYSLAQSSKTGHWTGAVLRKNFTKIRKKANLRPGLSCYSFRHWFANRIYLVSCQDSKLTQEAMRHADFSTTAQHYLRTPTEEINKAILNV